jgi:hypothetical protein
MEHERVDICAVLIYIHNRKPSCGNVYGIFCHLSHISLHTNIAHIRNGFPWFPVAVFLTYIATLGLLLYHCMSSC